MTLEAIAWISLGLAVLCAVIIAVDEVQHPQAMTIMNVVWSVTGLYLSVFALWAYFTLGRRKTRAAVERTQKSMAEGGSGSARPASPTVAQVAVGTSHCGAGCTLADIGAEFSIAATGLLWFGSILWTEFVLDFLVAWALGIVFQYFAIRPMRGDLSVGGTLWAAVKADTLSIAAFQVGMYAWMALVYFKLFPAPHHLTPLHPVYWLMMQIAMVCGFATSFPMNRLLIGLGLKEAM